LGHRVVATHAHHGGGLGDQFGDVRGAAHHGGGLAGRGGQLTDLVDLLVGHLRAGDQQLTVPLGQARGRGQAGEVRAVGAAAENGQQVGRGRLQGGAPGGGGPAGGAAVGEVAGGGGQLRQGRRQLPGEAGVVDAVIAVDP